MRTLALTLAAVGAVGYVTAIALARAATHNPPPAPEPDPYRDSPLPLIIDTATVLCLSCGIRSAGDVDEFAATHRLLCRNNLTVDRIIT